MAQVIFSETKKKYRDYTKHRDWLEQNSFPLFCGYSWLIDQKSLSIDHYKPQEHYPDLKGQPDNLILCASFCNSSKGDYYPKAKNRNFYKQDNHKIFNFRREDIGQYLSLKKDGSLYYKSERYKERFYFNSKVFRLNDPRAKDIRREYIETLKEFKNLHFVYKKIQAEKETDRRFLQRVERLLESRRRSCSRRFIFYKLLNIKIPKNIEKLLSNQTAAKFQVK